MLRIASSRALTEFVHSTGLKQDYTARMLLAGHAFVQTFDEGHYELAIDELVSLRLAVAFEEHAVAITRRSVVPASAAGKC